MKFLSHFAAKSCDNLKKGIAPAMLAAIALLFAAQSQSTRAQNDGGHKDDDGHEATAITVCGTVINQSGRYFLANDLKNCTSFGISITVSDVRIELRGHTIQQAGLSANAIDANGGTTGLSNLEIEGPGTLTGGSSGIYFGNVHRSRVHNVEMVGNNDGMDVNSGDFNNGTPDAATVSTENEIEDNVITSNINDGISVNGGNQNRFINNNLSGNPADGLHLLVASNNVARHNTSDANGFNGIEIAASNSGNVVEDNIALGNTLVDLQDDNPDCTQNSWTDNSFNVNFPTCIQ